MTSHRKNIELTFIRENPIPKYRLGLVSGLFSIYDWIISLRVRKLEKKIYAGNLSLPQSGIEADQQKAATLKVRYIIRYLLARLTSVEGLKTANSEARIAMSYVKGSQSEIVGLVIELGNKNRYLLLEKGIAKIKPRLLPCGRIGLLETVVILENCLTYDLTTKDKLDALSSLDLIYHSIENHSRIDNLAWSKAWYSFWQLEWLNLIELFFAGLIFVLSFRMIFYSNAPRAYMRSEPFWLLTEHLAEFFLLFLASIVIYHVFSQRSKFDYSIDVHSLNPEYSKKDYNKAKKRLDKAFEPFLMNTFLKKTAYQMDNLMSYLPVATFAHALLIEPDIFALRATVVKNFDNFSDLLTVALIGKIAAQTTEVDEHLDLTQKIPAKTKKGKAKTKPLTSQCFTDGAELDRKHMQAFSKISNYTWHKFEVDLRGSARGASTYQISWAVDYLARSHTWSDFFYEPSLLDHYPQNKGDNLLFPNLKFYDSRALSSISNFYEWFLTSFLPVQDELSRQTSLPEGKTADGRSILQSQLDFRIKIMYAGDKRNEQPNPLKHLSVEGSVPALADVHLGLKVGHGIDGRTVIMDGVTAARIIGYLNHSGITGGLVLDYLQESLKSNGLNDNWAWQAYVVPLPEDYRRLLSKDDKNEDARIHYLLYPKKS